MQMEMETKSQNTLQKLWQLQNEWCKWQGTTRQTIFCIGLIAFCVFEGWMTYTLTHQARKATVQDLQMMTVMIISFLVVWTAISFKWKGFKTR
jgi:hypothetical protein